MLITRKYFKNLPDTTIRTLRARNSLRTDQQLYFTAKVSKINMYSSYLIISNQSRNGFCLRKKLQSRQNK